MQGARVDVDGAVHPSYIRFVLLQTLSIPFERAAGRLVSPDGAVDFSRPHGEPSVVAADSVSWQVFRNPVTMFIGGIAAVLLELGEPRVRTAVWDHSSFRRDPAGRLRRTGMAAMVTVYGARSAMEALTARVRAMHARIGGETPAGVPYRADDPDLLRWVQGTAAFAFIEAYAAWVRPVPVPERARYYAEGVAGGALYGVADVPGTEPAIHAMIADMTPRLEPSSILHELMALVGAAEILPGPARGLQPLIVRAGVALLLPPIRAALGLDEVSPLRAHERMLLRMLATSGDRVLFRTSPAALACVRMGLPADYLLRR